MAFRNAEEVQAQIVKLQKSQKGYKSNFTRMLGTCASTTEMCLTARSAPQILEMCTEILEKTRAAFGKVMGGLEELQRLDGKIGGENAENYDVKLGVEQTRHDEGYGPLMAVVARMEAELRPRTPPPLVQAVAAGVAQPRYKPNEALKPKQLMRESTPVELRVWVTKFRAFFIASRLENAPIEEQHAYFRACLEDQLEQRISDQIVVDMPVLDDPNEPTCLDVLQAEFQLVHPLFARRLDYYRSKQARGQLCSDWTKSVVRLADEANLVAMTQDEACVMRYLSGIVDEKLLERLLQVDEPTKAKLDKAIQLYETGKVYMKTMAEPPVASAAAVSRPQQPPQPPQQPQQPRAGPARDSQVRRSSGFLGPQIDAYKAQGRCFKCGEKSDGRHDCRAAEHVCSHCSKKGHFEKVCMTKNPLIPPRPAAARGVVQPKADEVVMDDRFPAETRSVYSPDQF